MKKQQASIIREPERFLQALHNKSESLKSSKVAPDNRSADRPIPYSRGVSIKGAALLLVLLWGSGSSLSRALSLFFPSTALSLFCTYKCAGRA